MWHGPCKVNNRRIQSTGARMKFISAKSYLALLGVAAFSVLSVSCATVEGVGEDIEDAGDAIEDEAEEARRRR